jgi:hypothetical protein
MFLLSSRGVASFQPMARRAFSNVARALYVPRTGGRTTATVRHIATAPPLTGSGSGKNKDSNDGASTTATTGNDTESYLNQLEQDRKARLAKLLFPGFYETDYRLYVDEQSNFHKTGILPSEELKMHQRIIAVGDVHGDLSALINLLVSAKVMAIPESMEEALSNPKWIGGETILVQMGDILDRGPNELACMRLLSSLSRQALERDGKVVCLFGNHEVLNAVGLFQYADPSGNLEFEMTVGKTLDNDRFDSNRWRIQYAGNEPCRWTTFEPGGLLVPNILENFKVSAQIGRNVFVHAGLTKEHLTSMGGIEGMNRQAKEWIVKKHHHELENMDGDYDSVEDVLEAAKARAKAQSDAMPECLGGGIGSPSPVWMRDYSQPSDKPPKNAKEAQRMINEALDTIGNGAIRMVMGHTPQSQINAALGGKAWRVDVGASRGVMGGVPEVLEIIHGGGDADGMTDEVNVLTIEGKRIPGKERFVVADHFGSAYFD